MRYLRRALFVVLFAVLAVAGLIPAGSASAASGCTLITSNLFQMSQFGCSSGSYAATIVCKNGWGWSAYAESARTPAPYRATVYCPGGYPFLSHGGYIIYS